ncbi:MAG: thiamine-phosphate kinase [Planctomyces sp.]|nr:thiamine-phosphate kinase [Planctomyces sp.]
MADDSEWDWIDALRKRTAAHPSAPIGIGDDAALLRCAGRETLVATDMLMDGVDFVVGETPPELIGRKCLAVNLSDIAAMAGRPRAMFISLALPRRGGRALVEGLYAGLEPLAREFDVALAGGDTNAWDGPLVVNVTVVGEPVAPGPVARSGARPGDVVFVTGPLGGSLPSLRHCTFTPRVREALALLAAAPLHAMIDLSDGLATDLSHIARESGCGIVIEAERVPVHADVPSGDHSDRLRRALTDGEDFELAFCVSANDAARLESDPPAGVALHRIGEVVAGSGLMLRQGADQRPIDRTGWQHRFA